MIWVVFLIAMQLVLAAMVFFILKYRLGRELLVVALEKLHAATIPQGALVKVITVDGLGPAGEAHIKTMITRKATEAKVTFEQDAALEGGIVIEWPGQRLDFSVADRLKNFWA